MMASKGSSLNSVNLASRDETENSIESRLSELDKGSFQKKITTKHMENSIS